MFSECQQRVSSWMTASRGFWKVPGAHVLCSLTALMINWGTIVLAQLSTVYPGLSCSCSTSSMDHLFVCWKLQMWKTKAWFVLSFCIRSITMQHNFRNCICWLVLLHQVLDLQFMSPGQQDLCIRKWLKGHYHDGEGNVNFYQIL